MRNRITALALASLLAVGAVACSDTGTTDDGSAAPEATVAPTE